MKIKRSAAIIAIICIALIAGILINFVWTLFEKLSYPRQYSEYVEKYSLEYNIPEALIYATIKVESNFDPNVVSSAGAMGLMQMLPSTYEWLTSKLGDEYSQDALYDPETNIKYGTYYLQYLYSRFGSWEKAIIAYNWGEGNFSDFLASEGYTEGDYNSIPAEETRNYVKKVMHHWKKYKELY